MLHGHGGYIRAVNMIKVYPTGYQCICLPWIFKFAAQIESRWPKSIIRRNDCIKGACHIPASIAPRPRTVYEFWSYINRLHACTSYRIGRNTVTDHHALQNASDSLGLSIHRSQSGFNGVRMDRDRETN